MKARILRFFCTLLLLTCAQGRTVAQATHPGMPAQRPRIVEGYGRLPLAFEVNQGQTDPQVKFVSRGAGYNLFLTNTEAVLTLHRASRQEPNSPTAKPLPPQEEQSAVLHMKLVGANAKTEASGQNELLGKSNYFIGNDPKKWHSNVRQYARVRYRDVYPGVDLVYYGNQRELEYDFVLQPGASPEAIRLGIEGASKLRLERGDLVLSSPGGDVRLRCPRAYQVANGTKLEIHGRYVMKTRNEVGFQIASYDRRSPLIIDPVLAYSTYLGGSGKDYPTAIAVDLAGNAYVTGYTSSTDFPTANAIQRTNNGGSSDAFVTKINADGTALVYSTYLGGRDGDGGNGIAVDAAGNAYVTGSTRSTEFPTANAIQPTNHGGDDAFVTKINVDGSAIVFSTYLGGRRDDAGSGIVVNTAGNVYLTGITYSSDFPTANALQSLGHGMGDVFVSKINAEGSTLVYSTYLGGTDSDGGSGIAVDTAGNAYLAGTTYSTDFPTANAIQPAFGGFRDGFVSKINAEGSVLVYSTYLGGRDDDRALGIAADTAGNAYVAGYTLSTDFPTAHAIQPSLYGVDDAFVTKVNAEGSALVYSTYLGGISQDVGDDIAVDALGNAYVTGESGSADFPTANAIQSTNHGGFDAFVTKINADGTALVYSTYLGGNSNDASSAIAVDAAGNAYVTGSTLSSNFPKTLLAFQSSRRKTDGFVTKIASQTFVSLSPLKLTLGKATVGTSSKPKKITLTNTGTGALTINQIYIAGRNAGDFAQTNNCNASVGPGANCTISITFTPTAVGTRKAVLGISDSDPASPQAVALSGTGK